MQVIPQYDEFGIYTTVEDVKIFVTSLIEQGISSEEEVFSNCVTEFGRSHFDLIERVLYGED
jgi:hypothetical protein